LTPTRTSLALRPSFGEHSPARLQSGLAVDLAHVAGGTSSTGRAEADP
jgi:hypothetical protein